MLLLLFHPLTGAETSLPASLVQAREHGCDGIEGPPPDPPQERLLFRELLLDAELAYIGRIHTGGGSRPDPTLSPAQHLLELRAGIERCLDLSPILISARVGLDAWSPELQLDFFEEVLDLEAEFGIDLSFETSRGRPTFHPWATRDLLASLPDLKLTGDFGQWCCVTERLVLDHEPALLRAVAPHCWHLHAVPGCPLAPQVPNPRAAEWTPAVDSHLKWWETVWTHQAQRGLEAVTMTPDFRSFPRRDEPVPEWNAWLARTLRERFDAWEARLPPR
jgi:hypothetical protein